MVMRSEKEIIEELKTQRTYLKGQRENKSPERDIFYTLGIIRGLTFVLDEKMMRKDVLGED